MIERPSTRKLLAESLVELCGHTPYDKVTVRAIAENCGLSTRTFYSYFEDKDALVAWLFSSRNTENFKRGFAATGDYRVYSAMCADSFEELSGYYKNLQNAGLQRSNLVATVVAEIEERFVPYLREVHGPDRIDDQVVFLLRYYVQSCFNALIDWHMGGKQMPREKLDALAIDLMPPGLRPLLLPQ